MSGSEVGSEVWWHSSHCADGLCVEVAVQDSVVLVRQSGSTEEGPLAFSMSAWRSFIHSVKDGEFDH